MIPALLYQAGDSRFFTASANSVSFIGYGAMLINSSTSITVSIPSGIAVGDTLLAFVFARSTVTTPSGWTLVYSSSALDVSQRLHVFSRTSISGDAGASVNFVQSVSNRFGAQIIAIRGSSGSTSVASINELVSSSTSSTDVAIAGVYGAGTGGMFISAATFVSSNSGVDTPLSVSAGWTMVPFQALEARLGVAYRIPPAPETSSGNFSQIAQSVVPRMLTVTLSIS